MLAKKTSKNQLTLPKKIAGVFEGIDYFDVAVKDNVIILKPVKITPAESALEGVRNKIEALGQKEKVRLKNRRVVLDTNVVVSALLFRGELSRLHALWKRKAFTIVASREIVEEYLRVLAYPKFNLTEKEIRDIIQEE